MQLLLPVVLQQLKRWCLDHRGGSKGVGRPSWSFRKERCREENPIERVFLLTVPLPSFPTGGKKVAPQRETPQIPILIAPKAHSIFLNPAIPPIFPGGIAYQTSYCRKQLLRVLMLRVIINLLHSPLLHDLPAVHDEHAVADLVDDV